MAPHSARQVGTEQVLPSWLTYSPIVLPSGGTSYTILRLPLTYYGPSIPLGTDGTWTYGGLSSPAPSATPSITATSTAPPVTTSAPTTTSASTSTLPSSTTRSSSSSTTTTLSQPTTTSFATPVTSRRPTSTSSSPTSTSTSPPGVHGSRLPVVAIILIALGVAAALLLCCLIGCLLWRKRKSRRERSPLRGDSEFYAGPENAQDDESIDSVHVVPALTGERDSLLGNDSFVVVGTRPPPMAQRSIGGVSYQRLGGSQMQSRSSIRTDEIGVAYTDMPPPRTRRRTVTAVSNAVSSSPSHPTSSSQRGIGSMLNGSQRSSLFQHPAEQDESPVLPRDSAQGVVRRASDLDQRPIQTPAPAASPFAPGATLGAELGILGLGTRYPDGSQSLLATSSSGGSVPPRLVVPSSIGSRSRPNTEYSRPTSHMFPGSYHTGSHASRGHSPAPSYVPGTPPPRDTESPASEHDESAQLLTAERGNVSSGIGLLGRFSWFARGNGRSTPPRTSRTSYPGWMSPPTEEGFLAEADSQLEAGASEPPTLESKPPVSFPGMVRLVSSREREQPPTPLPNPSTPRPVSSVSGQSVYHDASSQPATPRSPITTWLGFLGRSSPAAGPAPPVPARPSPLSNPSTSPPLPGPSQPVITSPQPAHTRGSIDSDVDPASRLMRDEAQPPTDPSGSEGDILDAPAPESLLEIAPPSVIPPSPATVSVSNAPVFPPGLLRLPRTWNFGLLNELGDEPPSAEERWANLRSSPSLTWDLRRFSLGQTVRISSPHAVTDSQVASVHGGSNSNGRSAHGHSSPSTSSLQPAAAAQSPLSEASTRSRYSQTGGTMYSDFLRPSEVPEPEARSEGSRESRRAAERTLANAPSMSAMTSGTAPDTTTRGL